MGRIHPAGLFLSSFGLLMCLSQEAAGQSANRLAKMKEEMGDSSSDTRLRSRRPEPGTRGAEIFYCGTPDTSCRTTQDTFPIADLRDLFVFVV